VGSPETLVKLGLAGGLLARSLRLLPRPRATDGDGWRPHPGWLGFAAVLPFGVGTLTEIEAAADALPKEQKEELLAFLAARLGRTLEKSGIATASVARRAGLHAGAWEVAQDFDAPLPDAFWLGRDA
jgi:hypothetical protein